MYLPPNAVPSGRQANASRRGHQGIAARPTNRPRGHPSLMRGEAARDGSVRNERFGARDSFRGEAARVADEHAASAVCVCPGLTPGRRRPRLLGPCDAPDTRSPGGVSGALQPSPKRRKVVSPSPQAPRAQREVGDWASGKRQHLSLEYRAGRLQMATCNQPHAQMLTA